MELSYAISTVTTQDMTTEIMIQRKPAAETGRGHKADQHRKRLCQNLNSSIFYASAVKAWWEGLICFKELQGKKASFLTIYVIRVTLNAKVDTLQRSFFHAHATEWIILNVVLLESWSAKVCCIYLLRYQSWTFQPKNSVWKRMFFRMIQCKEMQILVKKKLLLDFVIVFV